MKKALLIVFACVLVGIYLLSPGSDSTSDSTPGSDSTSDSTPGASPTEGDVIYVVHFHRVHQCTCCINVGKWAEETLQKYFPDEYENGTLVYMDVCVEENRELATHYNAYGSSLFVNVVRGGSENIMEVTSVWNFCFDHDSYINYFKQYIAGLLEK